MNCENLYGESDRELIPKRVAAIAREDGLSRDVLRHELGYDHWYYDRLIGGKEVPDVYDKQRLTNLFGWFAVAWLMGKHNLIPFPQRRSAKCITA